MRSSTASAECAYVNLRATRTPRGAAQLAVEPTTAGVPTGRGAGNCRPSLASDSAPDSLWTAQNAARRWPAISFRGPVITGVLALFDRLA